MSTQPEWGTIPRVTFGDRVRVLRRMWGLSQEKMAEALDVGAQALAAWESGRHDPKDIVEMAQRVEDAFGVPASWTLGLNENGPHPDGGGRVVQLRARRYSKPQPSDPKVGGSPLRAA